MILLRAQPPLQHDLPLDGRPLSDMGTAQCGAPFAMSGRALPDAACVASATFELLPSAFPIAFKIFAMVIPPNRQRETTLVSHRPR